MLSHAARRALRIPPTPLRSIIPPIQLRLYANNNKPRRPQEFRTSPKPASSSGNIPNGPISSQGSFVRGGSAGTKSSDNSGKPDFSTAQDEFETGTKGGENTPPLSDGAGPGTTKSKAPEQSSQHYSKLQDEFQTSSSSDQNTAPQDTSPSAIDPVEVKANEKKTNSIPLPDLTKGIPSTLDAELEAASAAKGDPSNITRPSSRGRGERQMPASAYVTSTERRRNQIMGLFFGSALLALMISPVYLGRNWESEEEERKHPEAPSGWGIGLWYNRAKVRLFDTLDYYNEPAYPRLPDPDPMWARPYTLVLSLEDLLVHSEWSQKHGWRTAKRPGVDYFLRYLGQYYELVVFTSIPSSLADPIIKKLDPFRIITWPLFREATLYKNGEYIKDLSRINRPLEKVILLDTDPAHAKFQPENAIILEKWKGDPKDDALVALIPFLEYVAFMAFPDTRTVLKSFEGKPIAAEFAAREAAARKIFDADIAAEKLKRPKRSGSSWLSSALGLSTGQGENPDGPSLSQGFEQGKMLQDQVRERGQKQYEMIEKEIRENGEKFLKELADEEEKARNEQMKGMTQGVSTGILGFLGIGGEKKVEEAGEGKN